MKFFHLSDLHIGLKLVNRDLKEDQTYIFEQIAELAAEHQPEAIVIAGDIYDKAVPSAEAVELFDYFVMQLKKAVPQTKIMMISGNHDSAPRVNMFRGVLSGQNIHMIGMPPQQPEEYIEKVTLQDDYGNVNFYLLPFIKPSTVKAIVGTDDNGNNLSYNESVHRLLARESVDQTERNVLVSHQFYLPVGTDAATVERMDSEFCTVGNIDEVTADALEPFDYAALGHIHKPMKVGSEYYRYCGTPLACSISEAGQKKGIIMVELGEKNSDTAAENKKEQITGKNEQTEGKDWLKTTVLPLTPLRQMRVIKGTLEEVLAQGCDDYVSVLLTDKVDLDVFDMQDRLRNEFPNLLEIRRETIRRADYQMEYSPEKELDPFALCNSFLKDLDEEEQSLLQDVIHSVWEVK